MNNPLPQGRPIINWHLQPPCAPENPFYLWSESASVGLLLESIKRHAEVKSVGSARFSGSRKAKSDLWHEYRNYLRQAISNFETALTVPNRSACLLYYYAMMNFAKAELLVARQTSFVGQKLRHGLSFHPNRAKSVAADFLTADSGSTGLFKMLYEKRTGLTLGTAKRPRKLAVDRLLSCIPELSTQTADAGMKNLYSQGFNHLVASDMASSWTLLLILGDIDNYPLDSDTRRILDKHFHQIALPGTNVLPAPFATTPISDPFRTVRSVPIMPLQPEWRDMFAVSRRYYGPVYLFESNGAVPNLPGALLNVKEALGLTWAAKDIISRRHDEMFDAYISPSLYSSPSLRLRMPHSLARYAATYYASSLVRYKPGVFDSEYYPEQAHLFDALARECALPMLIDVLSELSGCDQIFFSSTTFRR